MTLFPAMPSCVHSVSNRASQASTSMLPNEEIHFLSRFIKPERRISLAEQGRQGSNWSCPIYQVSRSKSAVMPAHLPVAPGHGGAAKG